MSFCIKLQNHIFVLTDCNLITTTIASIIVSIITNATTSTSAITATAATATAGAGLCNHALCKYLKVPQGAEAGAPVVFDKNNKESILSVCLKWRAQLTLSVTCRTHARRLIRKRPRSSLQVGLNTQRKLRGEWTQRVRPHHPRHRYDNTVCHFVRK